MTVEEQVVGSSIGEIMDAGAAMGRLREKALIVLAAILADTATKLLALFFLPYYRHVSGPLGIRFMLVFHTTFEYKPVFAWDLLGYIALVTAFFLNRLLTGRWARTLAAAFCAVLVATAVSIPRHLLPNPALGGAAAQKLMLVFLMLWLGFACHLSKDRGFAYIWALALGSALGNCLSFIYPPFGAIDFLQVDRLPFRHQSGICNIADLGLSGMETFLIAYSPVYVFINNRERISKALRLGLLLAKIKKAIHASFLQGRE